MQKMILSALPLIGCVVFYVGCASTPPKPYWENPVWVAALNTSIQSTIEYPLKEAQNGWPILHATVQFTYESRQLKDLRVIKSTGSDRLDYYLVNQLRNLTDTPWSYGSYSSVPHTFQVAIDLKPTARDFYNILRTLIERHARFPQSAWFNKEQGWVIIKFDYRDGTVLRATVVKSNDLHAFGNAALHEFSKLKLPPPPPSLNLAGKTLQFVIPICYVFSGNTCAVNYPLGST